MESHTMLHGLNNAPTFDTNNTKNRSFNRARGIVKFAELTGEAPAIKSWDEITAELERLSDTPIADVSLYVIRHGHTAYNRTNRISGKHNTRLTDTGRNQARMLAEKFDADIEYIFSSDLSRAIDTARIYREVRGFDMDIITDYRLQEVNLGDTEGTRRGFWPNFAKGNIDFAPPNGESYRHAARRVASFLVHMGRFLETRPEPRAAIALFSHSGVMRIINSFISEYHAPVDLFAADFRNTEIMESVYRKIQIADFWLMK